MTGRETTDAGEAGKPFQYGLSQLLTLPVLVSLFCAAVVRFGSPVASMLLLLSLSSVGMWFRGVKSVSVGTVALVTLVVLWLSAA